jgi:hypothetical protein
MVRAFPEGTDEQKRTAEELGYAERPGDSAVAQMTREHDPIHSLVSVRLFGLPCSPTLRAVAEGTTYSAAPVEEERVLAFQRCLNQPPSSCPAGWRALRAEALGLLR